MSTSKKKNSLELTHPDDFKLIYDTYYLQVYRYMLSRLSFDQSLAEDLTAETFFKAWKKRRSFQGTWDSVRYWVFRIARNSLIDYTRKKRPDDLTEQIIETTAGDNLRDQHLIRQEESQLLWDIFHQLSEDKTEILILRYILKWQVKDIAAFLDINENAASKRIQRALEAIRDQWPQTD